MIYGKNLSLEDILDEYSPQKEEQMDDSYNGRLGTEKLITSAEKLNVKKAEEIVAANSISAPSTLRRHGRSGLSDGTLRRPNPADDVKPSDLARSKVSFVNSEAMAEIREASGKRTASGYDSAVMKNQIESDHTPKIRRMTDSTRAKEIDAIKKSRKKDVTVSALPMKRNVRTVNICIRRQV